MMSPPAALLALLFTAGGPVEKKQLAKLLEINETELAIVLETLVPSLEGSGLVVITTETEAELRTAPEASVIVKKLRDTELSRDLGKGSLETLAVIAYRDGTTRGDIDWVRGVNSSASLRTLLMRGLIEGREDEHDKRRVRYTLTTEALAHLGIAHTNDLPRASELRATTEAIIEEKDVPATELSEQ
jgi:segregation and condensation protein B